jgi:formamidopyrimidine-DNA glycosylase
MPELPEVEHLRRSLEPDLVGAHVERFFLMRQDIVRRLPGGSAMDPFRVLEGSTIQAVERLGKQLALTSKRGDGLVVQLGMSGQLRWGTDGSPPNRTDHVHARWMLRDRWGRPRTLEFRDPRRFGGLSPFESPADRDDRLWSSLGPDAIDAPADQVVEHLISASRGSRRPLKSLLLDQTAIAGIGNIYADEALFAAALHPRSPSGRLRTVSASRLVQEIRSILHRAVDAGGSTLRDYMDASGRAGSFQDTHRVYGRGGLACLRCSAKLRSGLVAGRTTVWCSRCQSRSSRTPPHAPFCT